jgi:hypothetical protein
MLFFRVLARLLGGFFKGIGRGFGGIFRWIARHEMFLGLVTSFVVVVFAIWLVLTLLNINIVIGQPPAVQTQPSSAVIEVTPTPVATSTPAATQPPVSRTNAPQATEAFMIGQINGDADEVWNSLTATLHNQLTGAGRDKSYFQRQFDDQKKNGLVYESYQYIGGVANANGTSIHFYVLTVKNTQTNVESKIPWTFEVDTDGKIAQADFPS